MKRLLVSLRRVFQFGRGRPVAIALLALFLAVLQFPAHSPFRIAQQALFDRYQRVFPRAVESRPVIVVDVDEASLKRHGQWPWPRSTLAALIDAIAARQPLAIGLDIYMPEADQTSPENVAARLPAEFGDVARKLKTLPDHDTILADSIRRAPVVLGAAGFDFQTLSTSSGLRGFPVTIIGPDPLPFLRAYRWVLASRPRLQAAASGQALLSVDLDDGIVRRIPLVMAVNEQVIGSLALEMFRVATGEPAARLLSTDRGITAVKVADLTIPTQENGDIWLHFAEPSPGRHVSATALLDGTLPEDALRDKLVLVGLTGAGLNDMRITPLGHHVPGIDIQAQVIEAAFDGRFLLRPPWLAHVESALLLLGGAFLVWAVPTLRARLATLLASALFVVLFGAGFALFRATGLLFDAASIFASLNVVFISLLGSQFIEADRERRLAEFALRREREAAARVAGELAAARRIQLGSLPRADRLFPGERRFEIAALLEPAREVGGDLFDFFMLDARNLFFIVGDVSGKGLPASLMMVVAKALGKSIALRGEQGSAAILSATNVELARENPEQLFVTAVAGVLNVDSGALELAIAGHDPPWRLNGAEAASIEGEGGPPLCVLDDFRYPRIDLQMRPGETLCVITDGITEAMDPAQAIYGAERLRMTLSTAHASAPAPSELLDAVRHDVQAFVAGAPATDDLTVLALRWNGATLPALSGH